MGIVINEEDSEKWNLGYEDYGYTEAQLERLLVLSVSYTETDDNNGSLNDWIAGMDKDNLGSLEDWLLNAGK